MLPPSPNPNGPNGFFGLHSSWSSVRSPFEHGVVGRFEGEVTDLVVFGEIPKELNGTFCKLPGVCCLFLSKKHTLTRVFIQTASWLIHFTLSKKAMHL